MRTWIKSPLAVFVDTTLDAGGGLVVHGNRISELVKSGCSPQSAVDRVFDASDHVLLPGLVNTHHHYYQTMTRAFPGRGIHWQRWFSVVQKPRIT